jgi:ABC-type uncharacterized transport system involved in gliding motility auxiliary subunit
MESSASLAGLIGLVCLVFGLIDYLVASGFGFFVALNLVFGIGCLIIWLSANRQALGSMLGSRQARYGANAAVYALAFVGVLVAVNYIAAQHEYRLDMTAEHVYSLSPQSIKVVQALKEPVKFYGFFEGGVNQRARSLYQMYAYASPKVSYELIDPDRHPELAERFKVNVMGTTRVQYGGDNGRGTNVTELSESALTNAIIKASQTGTKVACFLDGHGEADLTDAQHNGGFAFARQALEGDGYETKKVLLASQAAVSKDCNVLVIAGPEKPLLTPELDAVSNYLKAGGSVIALLRPPRPDQAFDESALVNFIAQWGIKPGNDIIVDQVLRLFAGPALGLSPIVEDYNHAQPVTESFTQRTVFPMTRSVEPDPQAKPALHAAWLARTSKSSWAETDLDGIFKRQEASLGPEDRKGPVAVCSAIDADLDQLGGTKGRKARMVVCGSTDFVDNQHINDFYNRDLFMNSVDWLMGEANEISIRPRTMRASRFRLTVAQFSIVFALSVLLLPELLLITGIVVWWQRRV